MCRVDTKPQVRWWPWRHQTPKGTGRHTQYYNSGHSSVERATESKCRQSSGCAAVRFQVIPPSDFFPWTSRTEVLALPWVHSSLLSAIHTKTFRGLCSVTPHCVLHRDLKTSRSIDWRQQNNQTVWLGLGRALRTHALGTLWSYSTPGDFWRTDAMVFKGLATERPSPWGIRTWPALALQSFENS